MDSALLVRCHTECRLGAIHKLADLLHLLDGTTAGCPTPCPHTLRRPLPWWFEEQPVPCTTLYGLQLVMSPDTRGT